MFKELATLWRLALPLALASAGMALLGVVDTAVVGRLGATQLAAVALGNGLFFGVSVSGLGLMMGLDPLFAQAFGAAERERIPDLLAQGVVLALLAALALGALLGALAFGLPHLGMEPEVGEIARDYLLARLLSLPPMLLSVLLMSLLQAAGFMRPLVWALLGANLGNLGANLLFVFGGAILPTWAGPLRHMPALGAVGSAVATTLAMWLEVAILLPAASTLLPHGFAIRVRRAAMKVRPTIAVGLPIGLQMSAEVGVFALVGVLAGRLGKQSLGAHQIALQLASLTFTLAVGIGKAGSVRVGWAVGARDRLGARRAGIAALLMGTGLMAGGGLLFALLPGPLAQLLTNQPELVQAAVPLLGVAALFQISDGVQSVAAGVLRGAGDTRFPFLANVIGHYVIGLPIALFLGFSLHRGIVGLWLGLSAGLSAVALALLLRFLMLSSREIEPLATRKKDALEIRTG